VIHKGIDISQSPLHVVSEDLARDLIDWRIMIKKPMTQRVFDNALKQATECSMYGVTQEEALERWMESCWTGMKWILAEFKREYAERPTTRSTSIADDLTNRSWANVVPIERKVIGDE